MLLLTGPLWISLGKLRVIPGGAWGLFLALCSEILGHVQRIIHSSDQIRAECMQVKCLNCWVSISQVQDQHDLSFKQEDYLSALLPAWKAWKLNLICCLSLKSLGNGSSSGCKPNPKLWERPLIAHLKPMKPMTPFLREMEEARKG